LALAHGQELLAHAFHWPELVERLMMGLLAAGFPLAITLAWYHGHKGLPRIGQGELMMLSLLLLIGAGLLVFLVRTPAERAVPGATMRPGVEPAIASGPGAAPARTKARRLAILPFDNLTPPTPSLRTGCTRTSSRRSPRAHLLSR